MDITDDSDTPLPVEIAVRDDLHSQKTLYKGKHL